MNKNRSDLLLDQLSRKLELGLYWSIFFLVGLIVVAVIHITHIQVLSLVGVMILMMAGNFLYPGRLYLKIKKEIGFSLDTRTVLVNYYNSIVKILRVQRLWAQFQ